MKTRILEEFQTRFGAGASLYVAPGRVNLIGEHTDYNGGFVMPGAIDKAVYAAIRPTGGRLSRLWSLDYGAFAQVDLTGNVKPAEPWAVYIYGVVQEMRKRRGEVGNFDCVFGGDIPVGAGLSSSAALESVFAFALNDLYGCGFSLSELARIGQMTEHLYVGVRCGIMDQFASLHGRAGQLIRLDCRSLEYEMEPFDPQGYRLVLVDSMVKHSLAATEYNVRRAQCERGVAVVARHVSRVALLRDVTSDMLDTYKDEMDEWTYRRCRYVIDENERLLTGCELLRKGDYAGFGRKMFETHRGLSTEYGVSCEELDFIQQIAARTQGVIGSRMMGGGFGGCVISMVLDDCYDGFVAGVSSRYRERYGVEPRIIDVVISDGARRIE